MKPKILVVDLDGTLYATNTFHKFLRFLLRYFGGTFRVLSLLKLMLWMFQRSIRIVSHARLKYNILKHIDTISNINYHAFVRELTPYQNNLDSILQQDFDMKILATAAPKCYVAHIAEQHGFTHCLATELPENEFYETFETIKEQKKSRLIKLLGQYNTSKINLMVTDHIDDIYVMQIAENTILVNPDDALIEVLKSKSIPFEIFKQPSEKSIT